MELGEPDQSGRRRPVPIEGAEEVLDVDLVIAAIGQGSNLAGLEAIETTSRGTIAADENSFQTSIPGVFAGGDVTNAGAGIAIQAIGDAKKAANVIDKYLAGEMVPYVKPYYVIRDDEITEEDFADRPKMPRSKIKHVSGEDRKGNFEEIIFFPDNNS